MTDREVTAPVDQWTSPPPDSEVLGAGGQLLHQDGPDDAHPRTECEIDKCGWEALTLRHLVGDGKTHVGEAPIVDFHQLLGDDDSQAWAIQRQLKEQLGRPYLATQLAAALPADVAMRLVQRIAELTGPELERRLGEHISELQADIDTATAEALARLAASADEKRRELTRERFAGGSRLS